jgi:protein-tyrosine-phosphatase
MPSVLFVCTANRFRSPIAAALFQKALQAQGVKGSWSVGSAGTWAVSGQPVLTNVLKVARDYGLDLSTHRSNQVDAQSLKNNDLILVMQTSHKEALRNEFPSLKESIYLLSEVVEGSSYDIPDLFTSIQGVKDVSADLDELISKGLQRICSLAIDLHNTENSSTHHEA